MTNEVYDWNEVYKAIMNCEFGCGMRDVFETKEQRQARYDRVAEAVRNGDLPAINYELKTFKEIK